MAPCHIHRRRIFDITRIADRPEDFLLHHVREADDGVQWRTQLVAHIRQELGFGPAGQFGLFLGIDQLPFEALALGDVGNGPGHAQHAAGRITHSDTTAQHPGNPVRRTARRRQPKFQVQTVRFAPQDVRNTVQIKIVIGRVNEIGDPARVIDPSYRVGVADFQQPPGQQHFVRPQIPIPDAVAGAAQGQFEAFLGPAQPLFGFRRADLLAAQGDDGQADRQRGGGQHHQGRARCSARRQGAGDQRQSRVDRRDQEGRHQKAQASAAAPAAQDEAVSGQPCGNTGRRNVKGRCQDRTDRRGRRCQNRRDGQHGASQHGVLARYPGTQMVHQAHADQKQRQRDQADPQRVQSHFESGRQRQDG